MLNKIMELAGRQSLFPADKLVHAVAGALLFLLVAGATFALGPAGASPLMHSCFSCFTGLTVSTAAALGKEAYDEAHKDKHTVDWLDAGSTIAGALVGVIGFLVIVLAA
jgi:hypothetical protein